MTTPTRTVAALLRQAQAAALAALILLAPALAAAQDAARMEELIRARVDDKSFMGAVLVARGDDVILSKGYGFANVEWNVPNTPSTKFRLGSVTKQFTAAAILKLAEQGKLKLEDTVKQHWADAPAAWDAITIQHLLTHTSGIPNFTNDPEYQRTWKFAPSPPAKTIGYFRDEPLDFAPGERMSYSNSGYVLLGFLVEHVSGQSYAEYLSDHVFEPLGMNDSGYDLNATIIPNRAAGYMVAVGDGGLRNAPYIDMTIPHGAGALYSTTEDLLRWTQGLFGGRLLSAASLEKMTTPVMNNYAFGLVVGNPGGRKAIEHNGGIEGFNTHLTFYPDSKITVAVLANVNGPAADQLAGQLGQLAHGDAVRTNAERTSMELPREQLERLAGSYELSPMATMIIRVEGNQLVSQLGPQPPVPLFAESETVFFARVVEAELEFEVDPSGPATALVLHQNGQERRAPRLAERPEVTLPADVLARYPGTYRLAPGFDLTITLENGQLMSQATGQGKVPIFAEAENRFFLKAANAQIEFVRDGAGPVTGLVLYQGGRETRAERQ
jgi:CubicO group peptidase (beta-lactamase class C family)